MNDDSRSRAKPGAGNAKAGARNATAGTQKGKTGTQNTKAAARSAQGGTRSAQAGTRNAQAGTRNATAGTRNATADTRNKRPWFGPRGLGMGYRPQAWQGYLVMLLLGAYAIFIGTLAADHHSPLILLAIAPAAFIPRLIAMFQRR